MVRTIALLGLLVVMFYCAAAAPARAQDAAGYAPTAYWHAQRQLLPGSLLARNASARELAVAAHAAAAQPQA